MKSVGKNQPENINSLKTKIITELADLSRLLGMIPSGGPIMVNEPITLNSIALSKWFSDARNSFLKLAISIGRALDIQLQ